MSKELAPVVLFVYNRPEHTKRTIEALSQNYFAKDTDIYIYSDAPKSYKQIEKVDKVRSFIHQASGFKSVTICEAKKNKGLAKSVISGVTEVINKHGKIIVLEDDLVTSKYFLRFMNEALDFYIKDSFIWSISGYQFPFDVPRAYQKTVYASYRSSSWGWATWIDRWKTIDWEIKDYLKYRYNPFRILKFCKGGTDLDKMLRYQMKGKIDSWAIRWCYNQSMQNKFTVYPIKSLVNSIGTDGSGTHCDQTSSRFKVELVDYYEYSFDHDIRPDKEVMRRFRKVVDRSPMRKIEQIANRILKKSI